MSVNQILTTAIAFLGTAGLMPFVNAALLMSAAVIFLKVIRGN